MVDERIRFPTMRLNSRRTLCFDLSTHKFTNTGPMGRFFSQDNISVIESYSICPRTNLSAG